MVLREPLGTDARLPASLVHREAGLARHPMGRTQQPRTGVTATYPAILDKPIQRAGCEARTSGSVAACASQHSG
jgi:hypothetical protein